MRKTLLSLIGGCVLACGQTLIAQTAPDCLWYDKQAIVPTTSLPWEALPNTMGNQDVWERLTLPVGNGRIGATGYGGVKLDCLVLNEVSLWSGGPNLKDNGHHYEFGPKSDKNAFGCYQPFAHLYIQFEGINEISDYRRSLNLNDALLQTEFVNKAANGDVEHHTRSCFASRPDDVLVYHAESDAKEGISAKVAILPFHDVNYTSISGDTVCMRGTLNNGENFEARVQVRVTGGKFSLVGQNKELKVEYAGREMKPTFQAEDVPYIRIDGAESFTLIVAMATDYKMDYEANWKGTPPDKRNEKTMKAVRKKSYSALQKAHLADYKSYYDRMQIDLGKTDPEIAKLPTDVRRARYEKLVRNEQSGAQPNDPELEALIYKYGRYVLIAGSQPGNLPVNLQGIWNNKVRPQWACDYHNNINLQMCYWGAEVANLSECHLPLINFIRVMQKPLTEMTRREFGDKVRGWTTRVSQNPWGAGGWQMWNLPVNAWYALHVWDHYQFTQDKVYLQKVAYPILKNVCNFWEDRLKEVGDNGEGLLSGPSANNMKPLSVKDHPELAEIKKGSLVAPAGWSHEWGPVEDGCMHDQQLVWELFDITARAANILGVDASFARSITDKKNRLVGNRVGSGGYLQEWIVDRPDKVSGHRHTSHLIGVYPGSTISPIRTPEFAKAAMKSLELRGLTQDNRRSWTWPWRTAMWARLHNREQAYEMVKNYICYNALENLFGKHPPMQMDGTYGMTGGMSEIFAQSQNGIIELLPALPDAWANGSIKGLKARGNVSIDMKWENGKVTSLKLTTTTPSPKPVSVLKNDELIEITPTYVSAPGKKNSAANKGRSNVKS